jgi:hypothetical protein
MASEKKPEWWQHDVQSINPEAQRLLENYSGFQPSEVLPHILKLVCDTFLSNAAQMVLRKANSD